MKKTLLLSTISLLLAQGLGAQYVTIPDANFRTRLMQALPSCFNAQQQLDTTCAVIAGLTTLNVSSANISNLTGVQYLDALTFLQCQFNQLTSLPTLPASLQYLYCQVNQLTSLPNLPATLKYLNCYHNQLTSLPSLPNSLEYLYCDHNQLTSLPSLPNSLRFLECFSNQLVSLPALPSSLRSLYCHNNQLTSLPALNNSLQGLSCYNNQLTSLPALNNSLLLLYCYNNQLTSLPALNNSLQYLYCYNNQLTSLPALPNSLQDLNCGNNQLTSLPALNNSLQYLYCYSNQLTSLPALNNSLRFLECYSNQLTSLPTLNNSLQYLYCYDNQLTSLPALNNSLQYLYCYDNQLTSLPALNNSLQYLYCYNNQLTSLPNLPTNLYDLCCNNNQLTSLPNFPASLDTVRCGNNQLTGLPNLNAGLQRLYCDNNQLTGLPALPNSLIWLHCQNNPFLSCLPLLPAWLQQLSVAQTAIPCLPNNTNTIIAGTAAANFLPLCAGPQQICTTDYPWAMGNVYRDLNANGQFDAVEPRVDGAQVNGPIWPMFSDANAPFWIYLQPGISNSVWPNYPYPAWNIAPDTIFVNAPLAGQAQDTLNFGVTPAAPNAQDLQTAIAAGVARPGFNTSASAQVLNAGTAPQSVTFSMTFPANWTLLYTIPPGGTVAGNTVTWQTPAPLGLFESATFGLVLNVPATDTIGTPFAYTVTANPPLGEVTPPDNSAVFSGLVQGAYDPNDKLVSPEILPPGYDPEEELVYTIRFQNTGNDTAFNVLIRDTLANTLRQETFRLLHSSHACVPGFEGPRQLKFTFSNILLVDSFTNEPASHGFVQFAIKPQPGLSANTVLSNRAGIYFDYNAPIITNYAETQVSIGTAIFAPTDVACFGGSDGSIGLAFTGNAAPFTFVWSNGATTQDLVGVAAGSYTVTVTDANGNTLITSATVNQPSALNLAPHALTPVSCNGGTDGALDLNVSGGTAPYTFVWSNGATTEDPTGLSVGNYTGTVTDANGCVFVSAPIGIGQPSALNAALNALTPVNCNGGGDGALDLNVSGGTAPYNFLWSNGSTTEDLTGIPADTYTGTVTDANGCVFVSATINIGQPSALNVAPNGLTPVSCNGAADGTLDLNVSGGTAPYAFLWSNGATTEDLTGIPADTYTGTVTDANGCVFVSAPIGINQPSALNLALNGLTAASCNGGADGTLDLSVSGGTAPYTFAWSNGATTEDLTGIPADTYTGTVTDANGCVFVSAPVNVSEPAAISVGLNALTPISCNGTADGALDLNVSGGTAPYTFAWSNGATTEDLTGIPADTYTGTITDANGCVFVSAPVAIGQPSALNLAPNGLTPVSCYGAADGALDLNVSGGTAPYTFVWNNGSTTEDISGLGAGNYTGTVTDANGCVFVSAPVNVSEPAAISVGLNALAPASCNGTADGALDLSVSGGTAPYSFAWNNGATTEDLAGLSAGNYVGTVTDANGCVFVSAPIDVSEPAPLACTATETPASGVAVPDGAVDLTVAGGTGPLTFLWSNGATSEDLGNVVSGAYTVTVTDGNGCTATFSQAVSFIVGTPDVGSVGQIALWPNPTNGQVSLSISLHKPETVTVCLYTATGQLLGNMETRTLQSANWPLDLSDQPSGMYWVRLVVGGAVMTQEIVKQ